MSYAGAGSRRDARLVRQHGRQLIGEEVTGRVGSPEYHVPRGKMASQRRPERAEKCGHDGRSARARGGVRLSNGL